MKAPASVPLTGYLEFPTDEMVRRASEFRQEIVRRRSVRAFSPREVPRSVIEDAVQAAASAPSGANLQPWHFVIVSDPATERRIREAA